MPNTNHNTRQPDHQHNCRPGSPEAVLLDELPRLASLVRNEGSDLSTAAELTTLRTALGDLLRRGFWLRNRMTGEPARFYCQDNDHADCLSLALERTRRFLKANRFNFTRDKHVGYLKAAVLRPAVVATRNRFGPAPKGADATKVVSLDAPAEWGVPILAAPESSATHLPTHAERVRATLAGIIAREAGPEARAFLSGAVRCADLIDRGREGYLCKSSVHKRLHKQVPTRVWPEFATWLRAASVRWVRPELREEWLEAERARRKLPHLRWEEAWDAATARRLMNLEGLRWFLLGLETPRASGPGPAHGTAP